MPGTRKPMQQSPHVIQACTHGTSGHRLVQNLPYLTCLLVACVLTQKITVPSIYSLLQSLLPCSLSWEQLCSAAGVSASAPDVHQQAYRQLLQEASGKLMTLSAPSSSTVHDKTVQCGVLFHQEFCASSDVGVTWVWYMPAWHVVMGDG